MMWTDGTCKLIVLFDYGRANMLICDELNRLPISMSIKALPDDIKWRRKDQKSTCMANVPSYLERPRFASFSTHFLSFVPHILLATDPAQPDEKQPWWST